MRDRLAVEIAGLPLKNPLIAASGEHLIEEAGIRAALDAGAGVVVVKSTNEAQAAKDQLDRAEYALLDSRWNRIPWAPDAPPDATIACRSGLYPGSFDQWLDMVARLDREAAKQGAYVAASGCACSSSTSAHPTRARRRKARSRPSCCLSVST